jgi:uncharacterized protein (DUF1499 family)
MMLARLPKIALWLSLALLGWFAVAVFGPKFGIIDWQTGLLFMVMKMGVFLVAGAALFALVALAASALKKPRTGWWRALIALAIPLAIFAGLASVRAQGEAVPPIHDVTTSPQNPPVFTARTLAIREAQEANPIPDYSVPLGEMEPWSEAMKGTPLAAQNHAEIIAQSYPDLASIAYSGDAAAAITAISAAMNEIGLTDVTVSDDGTRVEGVAETFAFGFKDDVVVRVAEGAIDIRSVSRVGLSDLGYNAERVRALSSAIEAKLSS